MTEDETVGCCRFRGCRLRPLAPLFSLHWVEKQLPMKHHPCSLSRVRFFVILWTAAHQASLSFTLSQSFFKLMSIELLSPSNHLIICHPLLLLPSIFPSIRVFSNQSAPGSRENADSTTDQLCD